MYLGALEQHRRILHARLIVRGVEGDGLVVQHHSHHVLQADVGHVAVIHDPADRGGKAHYDALHLISLEGLLAAYGL